MPRPIDLLQPIVDLRLAIEAARDPELRAQLRDVEVALRRMVGPSVAKRPAAQLLGISVTALDRWLDRGYLTAVSASRQAGRLGVETAPLLELATRVTGLRRSGHSRAVVAKAIAQLGWRGDDGRRIIDIDTARLPRPNVSPQELRRHYLTTTPAERVMEVAALHESLRVLKHGEEAVMVPSTEQTGVVDSDG